MNKKNTFKCAICKSTCSYDDSPMLLDEIWYKIWSNPKGLVCLDCMEERLGRKITEDDLMMSSEASGRVHVIWNSAFVNKHFAPFNRYPTVEHRLSKSQRLSELQQKNDRKILEHIESLKDITMSLYTMVSHGDPRDELYKCGKNAWDIADKLYKLIGRANRAIGNNL